MIKVLDQSVPDVSFIQDILDSQREPSSRLSIICTKCTNYEREIQELQKGIAEM